MTNEMDSARVVIHGPGLEVRSGILYHELPALMRELYDNGQPATAYDRHQPDLVVGESDPSCPDRWHARSTPPLRPCR